MHGTILEAQQASWSAENDQIQACSRLTAAMQESTELRYEYVCVCVCVCVYVYICMYDQVQACSRLAAAMQESAELRYEYVCVCMYVCMYVRPDHGMFTISSCHARER